MLTGKGQHGAGTAADIQNRARGHDQLVIEAIAGRAIGVPRVQQVIQRGVISIGEHPGSIGSPPAAINRFNRRAATRNPVLLSGKR